MHRAIKIGAKLRGSRKMDYRELHPHAAEEIDNEDRTEEVRPQDQLMDVPQEQDRQSQEQHDEATAESQNGRSSFSTSPIKV